MNKSEYVKKLERIYLTGSKEEGDAAVSSLITEKLYNDYFGYALRYAGDAEGVREVIINAVLDLRKYPIKKRRHIGNLQAYIYRILKNRGSTHYRKFEKTTFYKSDEYNPDIHPAIAEESHDEFWNLQNPDAYKHLDDCKKQITDLRHAKICEYHFALGLKHADIAEKMQITVNRLRVIKQKLKRDLLKCLKLKKMNGR